MLAGDWWGGGQIAPPGCHRRRGCGETSTERQPTVNCLASDERYNQPGGVGSPIKKATPSPDAALGWREAWGTARSCRASRAGGKVAIIGRAAAVQQRAGTRPAQRIAVSCAAGRRHKRHGPRERQAPANCEAPPCCGGMSVSIARVGHRARACRGPAGERSLRVTCAQVEAAPAASGCTALLDGTSVERSEAPPEPKASVRRGMERRVKHMYSSVAIKAPVSLAALWGGGAAGTMAT